MFGEKDIRVDLPAEVAAREYRSGWEDDDVDDLALVATLDELNTGWSDEDRHLLPDLSGLAPGTFLAVIVEGSTG